MIFYLRSAKSLVHLLHDSFFVAQLSRALEETSSYLTVAVLHNCGIYRIVVVFSAFF